MAFDFSISVIILLMGFSELLLSNLRDDECTMLYLLILLWFQIYWLQTKCGEVGVTLSKYVSATLLLVMVFKTTSYLLSIKREEVQDC